jgi:crotonobetainyl-CoA:carnitine CoA-transferase CaiB-like acyl-CoA transferase
MSTGDGPTDGPGAPPPRDDTACPGPLEGIRVLDIADRPGAFAAKLLGDLGADVVKVEPPAGDALRHEGPYWRDRPHPDRSLAFWFYNASKRGLVLDFDSDSGRRQLARLAARADVVIETRPPGRLEATGLDYDALRRINPGLVHASITPFGESGPRSEWQTSEIVAQAVSGMLYVSGAPDAPPLATAGTQAYHSTGAYTAIAVVAALLARERIGRGQHIEVSIQEATAAAVEHVAAFFHQMGRVHRRAGSLHWTRYFRVARCRDGYVLHSSLGDWTSLLEWVKAEGKTGDLVEPAWEDFNHRRVHCQHLFDVLDQWAATHTVAEIMEGAQLRRIPYAAVRPPAALAADPQLAERKFFVPIEEPGLAATISYPGGPCRMSETPWTVRRRPPHLGEHTHEILESLDQEAATSGAALASAHGVEPLPRRGDAPRPGDEASDARRKRADGREDERSGRIRPLDGIRILDFTWVVAGPAATRLLGDLGAQVIKIERRDSLDFGDRRGGFTGSLNRGKQSMVVNLADARGLDIVRRLVARVDVVIDNFSARVMGNWGLDYDGLRGIRPDVIAVSMSGFGHSGPYRDYVSYGPTLQALAGYTYLMRHPGGAPAGIGFSYSDLVGGYTAALATLAALWHRRRTGRGQMIDLSQLEASCAVLGPMLLDVTANGRAIDPPGNASQEAPAAPHGVYRCRGEDRWCAIAVFGDEEWRRFVAAAGEPGWSADPRFASPAGRLAHCDALDALVETWTREQSPEEVAERLQRAGVRAGVVADAEDLCVRDPHLHARGYWVRVKTPEGTEVILDGIPYRLGRTPAFAAGPGPLLGEHTAEVLCDLLGLGDAEIATLRAERVVA